MTATTPPDTSPDMPIDPPLECDLVMKGGITSGVVYPLAVCELARVYRLRSVGGSSAGAIAAAAAAAAELGRAQGGFEKLAELPGDLTDPVRDGDSRLFTLFQPQPSMRRLFRLVTSGLGDLGMPRARAMLLGAVGAYAVPGLLGAAPGLVVVVLALLLGGAAAWLAALAGLVLALVGLLGGVAVGLLLDVRRIPDAGFGLCSGLSPEGATLPALTPWLDEVFQTLAGRTTDEPALTFGDLEQAGVTLRLMTTNLSRREPMSMPWDTAEYAFDPAEMRRLFPERVVAQLEAAAPASDGPLRRFPAPADLPVLVAVRMSLSFPGLIAAVPLHAVDWSLERNQRARDEGREPEWQVNWFSDGGICANLPLHFFDSALPRRPTFAIDLAAYPADRRPSSDQDDNSYLPTSNSSGLLRRQDVWTGTGLGLLVEFFSSIIDTARTWVDEAQLSMPGYRDRIVTVFTAADEGGLNLSMPRETVIGLSERGEGAARRLVDRFGGEQPGVVPAPGWDNHRWLRFRTSTAALSDWLASFERGYETQKPGTTPYADWAGVTDGHEADAPLPSYELSGGRRHAVNVRTADLLETAEEWRSDPADAFTHDAPAPRPAMKLVPADRTGDTPLPPPV